MPDTPSPSTKLSPILGLPVDETPASELYPAPEIHDVPFQLTVIIPARNEEHNLPSCLSTLLSQSEELFLLGRDWELLVVDDASTDRTRCLASDLASQHPGLRILDAPAFDFRGNANQPGGRIFTGKTNACWHGAQQSQGRWLLFTDADTLHEPGNLLRALHEAERHNVSLLSYSPRQIVSGLAQRALMPLIFSELASVYPPAKVNDPADRTAAANGQFLLAERSAYFAVGGHREVGRSVLEDVDLAYNIKRSRTQSGSRHIRLRFAPDALSTRMYAGFTDMVEGWSKNLALLFPHALALAAWRMLDLGLLLLPLVLFRFSYLVNWQQLIILALWARTVLRFYGHVARSHFPWFDCAISPLALPLLVYLLLRSWANHKIFHQVAWKGRDYSTGR